MSRLSKSFPPPLPPFLEFDRCSPALVILVVDSSAENRDVLCTLLERLGAETIEAARTRHASGLAETCGPM